MKEGGIGDSPEAHSHCRRHAKLKLTVFGCMVCINTIKYHALTVNVDVGVDFLGSMFLELFPNLIPLHPSGSNSCEKRELLNFLKKYWQSHCLRPF